MVESHRQPETPRANQLSDLGQYAYQGFIDSIKAEADPFFKDLDSTETGVGIMSKATVMGKERMEGVQAFTGQYFHKLVDQVAKTYRRRLFELDGAYKARLAALEGGEARVELDQEFQRKFTELQEESGASVAALRAEITDFAQQFGGANEFLDTAEEIDRWARYGLPILKNLKPDDVSLTAAGLDVKVAKNQYRQAFKLLRKLRKGEDFNLGEYEQIFAMMGPYLDQTFERTDRSATRETLSMLERSGALVLVEAMNPGQRFKLGEAWINHPDRNPMQKRQGILFLASANYLMLRQADELLRRIDKSNPDQYALREEEWKALEETQALVKAVKEEAAKTMGRNPQRSITGQYFTASNAMFYEVIGRVALAGTALSTLVAVKQAFGHHGFDPTRITQTLISPPYLACVATVGVTYEHLTGKGDMGKGGVSRVLAGLQTKETETPEEKTAREKTERLQAAVGENVETVAFLRRDKGKILEQIRQIAEQEEHPESYRFRFADLVRYRIQEEEKKNGELSQEKREEVRKQYDAEYDTLKLDYRTRAQSEIKIAGLFNLLAIDQGLQTTSDMLAMLDEVDREIGLNS